MNNQLDDILLKLGQNIRRYVLLEGLALLVLLLGLFFWGSLLLDWVYFWLFKQEIPVLLRQIVLFGILAGTTLGVIRWLVIRLALPLRQHALALVLEKRFQQLDDRLITAIQLPDVNQQASPFAQKLLEKTIHDARELAARLNLGEVFNQFPLRRAVTLAAITLISILVLAISNQSALARWAKGYLFFQERYWERKTLLEAQIIAQPGDRVKEFVNMAYKHPRGEDLTLLVKAKPGTVAPQRVSLTYRTDDGASGRVVMSTIEPGVYRHTITNVVDDLQINLWGGDFSTYTPYQIQIVEPPQIDAFTLWCQYPAYTNLNKPSTGGLAPYSTPQYVQGLSANLPVGTRFLLSLRSNKPLNSLELRTGRFEVTLEPSNLVTKDNSVDKAGTAPWQETGTFISANGVKESEFKRPQPSDIADHSKDPQILELLCEVYPEDKFEAAFEKFKSEEFAPLPLSIDNQLKIYLEDTDGVLSVEPIQCRILGVLDEAPVVDVLPKGIGQAITRKASIPLAGLIKDDYGLTRVQYVYSVDQQELASNSQIKQNAVGLKELHLGDSPQTRETFEVLPLNLNLGQKISLTVEATDGDTVTGPHIIRGAKLEFQIVSEEDLLSLLFQKELNLRKRFEQIIEEVKAMKEDITKHQLLYKTSSKESQTIPVESSNAIISSAERSMFTVRQKATEVLEIESSFSDIREELMNNNLDNQIANERLNNKIIIPLQKISSTNFPRVDEQVGIYKLVAERLQDPLESMGNSLNEIEQLQIELEKILAEMQQLENFLELVELLKSIAKDQEEIRKMTDQEKKKKLIELQDLM